MISIQLPLLVFVFWSKVQSVQNCCIELLNELICDSSCNYQHPCQQTSYDCSSYTPPVYVMTYPQQGPYDYYYQQSTYNPCSNDPQQPIVVVVNGNDDDNDNRNLLEILALLASLKDTSSSEPIYVPYPVPCCNCDSEDDYGCESDCGCKSCGCGYNNDECGYCDSTGYKNYDVPYYDSGCSCKNKCNECKKQPCTSKCSRNSGNVRSHSDCGCNKICLKHKSDRCFRG